MGKVRKGSRKDSPIYTSTPRVDNDRVSNLKYRGDNSGGLYVARTNCAKCGRKHEGKCLVGLDRCYGCGKSGHKMRDLSTFAERPEQKRGRKPLQAVPTPMPQNKTTLLLFDLELT